LIGLTDMGLVRVGIGVDRDRFYRHLATGAKDPPCDLATIGYQDSADHRPAEGTGGNYFGVASVE
jgi:hypothetical protein